MSRDPGIVPNGERAYRGARGNMRTALAGASTALILAGCAISVEIPTDPDTFSVETKAVAHLRPAQAVALINGYETEAKEEFKSDPFVTWVFDARRLTDTVITMLRRPMEKHGMTLDARAGKSVTLRLYGMRGNVFTMPPIPYAHVNAHLSLEAQFGDGTRAVIEASNGAPISHQRAFDGAALFALYKLLVDPNFVAYMNR